MQYITSLQFIDTYEMKEITSDKKLIENLMNSLKSSRYFFNLIL